jgi:hypothetical protein
MLTPARLARALKSLKRVTIHGPWTRAVRLWGEAPCSMTPGHRIRSRTRVGRIPK